MLIPGLVSITFRQLTAARIIELVKKSGLRCIEWGGDIHVPHGDLITARTIRCQCEDANILLPTYGSYYRVGSSDTGNPELHAVLDSAAELGVSDVRIWAGTTGSANLTVACRSKIIEALHRDSEAAAKYGLNLSLEFHANTLTDNNESVKLLLVELQNTQIKFYWQPVVGKSIDYQLDGLTAIGSLLAHIHVFNWQLDDTGVIVRQPLAHATGNLGQLLSAVTHLHGPRAVMLEFVKNDSIEQFFTDAKTLQFLIDSIDGKSTGL